MVWLLYVMTLTVALEKEPLAHFLIFQGWQNAAGDSCRDPLSSTPKTWLSWVVLGPGGRWCLCGLEDREGAPSPHPSRKSHRQVSGSRLGEFLLPRALWLEPGQDRRVDKGPAHRGPFCPSDSKILQFQDSGIDGGSGGSRGWCLLPLGLMLSEPQLMNSGL